MGEGLVDDTPSPDTAGYTERFNEVFPYYLTLGMTYDLFWNKDCTLVRFYREAEKIRQDRMNYERWLQGAYFYEAMARVSPVLNGFVKRGTKPHKYLDEPFKIASNLSEEIEEQKAKKTFHKAQAFMAKFMADTDKRLRGDAHNADND